ncbi:hypothetical protein FVEN_g3229 [Fusarium venenatum]|nr:hypothetical protein FVEN_g3229 [Fusarium venenatum]
MTTQVFRAAIIQTPQRDKDLLSVKADGSEDLYRQSGDPCNVTIGGVMLEKTSAEHDEAALAVYKALKDADTRRCPLQYFNRSCQQLLARPLTPSQSKSFARPSKIRRKQTAKVTRHASLWRMTKSVPSQHVSVRGQAPGDHSIPLTACVCLRA